MSSLLKALFGASVAFLICASATRAASPAAKQERFDNPVIFQRAEVDEQTGKTILAGKIWVMDLDGSGQRKLTTGDSYNEHASLYSDQRHGLYSEFGGNAFDRSLGARLIRIDIYTGEREVIAELPGCALHHASLSPINDQLVYHRDCGKRESQWVGWGPGSYEVVMRATNGVAIPGG